MNAIPIAWGRFAFGLLCVASFIKGPIAAAEEAMDAAVQAQSYFEADEARKAVATLAEAASRHPEDRIVASLLYSAIRDHVWHIPQTLPLKHTAAVTSVAFSPDGTHVASASVTGELWISSTTPRDEDEREDGRVAFQLDGPIIGISFARDGKRLIAATATGTVCEWNIDGTEIPIANLGKPERAATFAVARDADLVIVGSVSGSVRVFDPAAGEEKAPVNAGSGTVSALAISPTGRKIAVATGASTADVWDLSTGAKIGTTVAHHGTILSLAFSIDERYVLSAGDDSTALLSNPIEGVVVIPKIDCGAVPKKIRFSPDGSMIAIVLDDNSVGVWDFFTGRRLSCSLREDAEFNDFLWTHTSLRAATISEDGHASLWSMRNGTRRGETLPHDAPVRCAALSRDSKLLATGCADGVVRIWRTDGGMPLATVRSHASRARTAFYSADGEHLVTTSDDHTALQWRSGRVTPYGPALKHRGKVTCGVFDLDADHILTSDDSGIAQIWNAETGHADGDPFVHKGPVNWVDYHPNGERCITASGRSAYLWSVKDRRKPLATLTHPGAGKSELKCARFSPDGKWIVTGGTDGTARIWDSTTYKPTGVSLKGGGAVLCVRFSPDGSRLLVAGEDGNTTVYDTATWKAIGVPVITPGAAFSAAITEDNRFVVITSFLLNAVLFFDIETGGPLGKGLPLPTQATCVDYLVADKIVIVACDDGTVRAVEAPFVTQNTPGWMIGFTERLVGLRKTGQDTFERVDSHFGQLTNYVTAAARGTNSDFPKLVRWKMAPGSKRNGMPRFTSTLESVIERRVEERSVDALFDCYEAVSVNPLIEGALSLYLANPCQAEFLADIVLKNPDADPMARCLAAGSLTRAGRSEEARAIFDAALTDAPNNSHVMRRAAKFHARMGNKQAAIELFSKALELEPDDAETRRSYAWALYNFGQPAEAAAQFLLTQEITGEMVDDIIAGQCLCAAAMKNETEARSFYRRLLSINPEWKSAQYVAGQRGWTQMELSTLEKVRQRVFPKK